MSYKTCSPTGGLSVENLHRSSRIILLMLHSLSVKLQFVNYIMDVSWDLG